MFRKRNYSDFFYNKPVCVVVGCFSFEIKDGKLLENEGVKNGILLTKGNVEEYYNALDEAKLAFEMNIYDKKIDNGGRFIR